MNTSKPTLTALFFLISAILVLVTIHSSAQEQFRLSDYKNPDYRWQKLDIGFGLGGNNSFSKEEEVDQYSEKNTVSQFSSGLDARYYGTKNSVSYQGFRDISLNTGINSIWNSFEDLENDDNWYKDETRSQNLGLGAETINRFYIRNKWFLEADLDFSTLIYHSRYQFSTDQYLYPYKDKTNTENYSVEASLPLLAGIGRIEEVQDARLAVYILDDLFASGDITRTPDNAEILAFAEFITQTKNKRYFDSRLRKIAEITAIDSFLTVTGLRASGGASYFTIINDDWDFASGPVRSTGSRFSIGLAPIANFKFDENEESWKNIDDPYGTIINSSDKSTVKIFSRGLDFLTGYLWEKPASLSWQHTIGAGLAYSLFYEDADIKDYADDTLTVNLELRTEMPNIHVDFRYMVGYYPNSRTQLTLGLTSGYYQYWGDRVIKGSSDVKIDLDNMLVQNNLQLSCYYYISPQLRFALNFGSFYSYTRKNPEVVWTDNGELIAHDFQNSISARLTYSIF